MRSRQQSGLQRLSAFLDVFQKDSPSFLSIQSQARSQTRWLDAWRSSVAPPLGIKCTPVAYDHGVLSVLVPSQAWAQKLRFERKSIEARLRKHPEFANLESLKTRIQPSPAPLPGRTRRKESPRKPISRETAELLLQVADSIHDDRLADSLRRIASRHGQPSGSEP